MHFAHVQRLFNSFGAKFQTAFVWGFFLLFFLNKLSLGKKFICKVERLNVKQHRSGSILFAKPILSPMAVKGFMLVMAHAIILAIRWAVADMTDFAV